MKEDITPMELSELVSSMSTQYEERFNRIEASLVRIEGKFDSIDENFVKVFQQLNYLDTRVERIEKNMVYKSQIKSLVAMLEREETISNFDAAHVLYDPPERSVI